jgi:hypothetical protein
MRDFSMNPIVKLIVFKGDYKVLIAKIREVGAEIGEPDCELTDPVEFIHPEDPTKDWKQRLRRWPGRHLTAQNQCRISSDAILTLVDPEVELLEVYNELIAKN